MLRDAGVESICRQVVVALDQAKVFSRHKQVQEPAHAADTAIAVGRIDIFWRFDLKLNPAAMATAFVRGHVAPFFQTAK
jgi:hypothetical protein